MTIIYGVFGIFVQVGAYFSFVKQQFFLGTMGSFCNFHSKNILDFGRV